MCRSANDNSDSVTRSSFPQRKADALFAGTNCFDGCGLHQPANTAKDSLGQDENPLTNLWASEVRGLAQRENGFKTQQQVLKPRIVLPGGQLGGRETIRQLIVRHQRPIGFLNPQAYQPDAEPLAGNPEQIFGARRPVQVLQFPVGEPGSFGYDAWESASETDRAEGASNETLKPTTARLAISTAGVSQGRRVIRPDNGVCVRPIHNHESKTHQRLYSNREPHCPYRPARLAGGSRPA